MQKISGILPSTPRIASVDMKEGQAARPGGPSFGRPLGSSNGPGREALATTAQIAGQRHEELMDRRSKDMRDAELVKHMSDDFFMKRVQDEIPEIRTIPEMRNQSEQLENQNRPRVMGAVVRGNAPLSTPLESSLSSDSSAPATEHEHEYDSEPISQVFQDPVSGEMVDAYLLPKGSYLDVSA